MLEGGVHLAAWLCILFVVLILFFLARESGGLVFKDVFQVVGRYWRPISEPPQFGVLPLLAGSLLVTLTATAIAVPLGVGAAIYIGEFAPPQVREILKVSVEFLAAIPSVVIGFLGMIVLAPLVKSLFNLPTGLTALSASLMLAWMAMPTIVSLTEDALRSVPDTLRHGAYALGATRWQTIRRVLLPAAKPGILAATMLGVGRVIGETMAVLMISGNAARIPHSVLEPIRTLTATIAAEMGETVQGSDHYQALFSLGLVLFGITLVVNTIADRLVHRGETS
ncbi:phosphate ABC transporter permease subunit PstC [bacterium]|nr:phosphate ABC transporter permease subunit PstC [bacterium]